MMTERERAIAQIADLVAAHRISEAELRARVYGAAAQGVPDAAVRPPAQSHVPQSAAAASSRTHVVDVVYGFGALIVMTGVWTLVGVNWNELEVWLRVGVTVAVVVLTYLVATLADRRSAAPRPLTDSLHFVAIASLPFALWAVAAAVGLEPQRWQLLPIAIAAVTAVSAFGLALAHQRAPFLLAGVLAASTAYVLLVDLVADATLSASAHWRFVAIAIALAGIAQLAVALLVPARTLDPVRTALVVLGSLAALAGLFSQTAFGRDELIVGDLVFLLAVAATVWLSTATGRTVLLVFAAIALAAFIVTTTIVHFAGSFGWPVALVVSGFAVMTVTFGAVRLTHLVQQSRR